MRESKLYLFDMDGVLFNTKLNMKKSWNNVRKKFKLHIKFENYFEHIGIPFEKILEKQSYKCANSPFIPAIGLVGYKYTSVIISFI